MTDYIKFEGFDSHYGKNALIGALKEANADSLKVQKEMLETQKELVKVFNRIATQLEILVTEKTIKTKKLDVSGNNNG